MGLIDDLSVPTDAVVLTRRKALGTVSGAALAFAGIGTAITTVRYLRPNVLFEPPTRFEVGRPEDIPVGTLIVLEHRKLYVFHAEEGFIALSAECTHLGCMTRWDQPTERVVCPCHGSSFDNRGRVSAGPAPRPLTRLGLELTGGQLVVDTRKSVTDDFALKA